MSNWGVPPVRGRGMVKFTPFVALTEQFDGIREIIKEQNKVLHPILTIEEKERIEYMLVYSLSSEEEIMLTYYEDGYILSNYMTVTNIDPSNSTVICTDAFYNKMKLQFSNIIDVK
ncbi:YolD-like family protein [Bacillus thuringiensis]|uniref:3-oxoacyl-ACP synthase n=1 Tax=Bacillus thuringiensis subsp. kurstaki TaxID=29339 RepID=Q3YN22_BACTK|nr:MULTISPECIES: YolD-like family protein [Bacillus cereus group]MEB9963583.1 YolD-like family protein [Bacillus cereus]AAZ06623.1 hypothetical protein pAW63_053 [Bacillus thuringiensis serovar kurstaki]AGE81700.1 hypothetical protein HD73_7553 [Bacillus thuringiensis serovar kurstaki str. HD73]AND11280.1 3-oxoacyl-ACP synthase [Bacillus thuringiensis serovar alesti]EJV73206.1 hypothetical protein IG1_05864 [Bacillus cereus HD73]